MIEPTDWEARLAEQSAAYRQRRERQQAERAQRAARRSAGLQQRHAAKLEQTAPGGRVLRRSTRHGGMPAGWWERPESARGLPHGRH